MAYPKSLKLLTREIACELLGCPFENDGDTLYAFEYDNEKFTITGELRLPSYTLHLSERVSRMNSLLARVSKSGTKSTVEFCPPVEEWSEYSDIVAKFTNVIISIDELRNVILYDVRAISDIYTISHNDTTINVSEYVERNQHLQQYTSTNSAVFNSITNLTADVL